MKNNYILVVKEILDELVEQICYDEATQGNENDCLSTNEIIEDIQSTPDEFHNTISRNTI
ncbi:unnamed protein product, partial [Rotaria magnacalcarata]